jgi:plastocyanin
MKIVFSGLFFLSLLLTGAIHSYASTATVLVGSGGNFFSPASFTICEGDTVYFVWAGGVHNVHITNPATAASPDLEMAGDTFTYVPAAAGNYTYQCDHHAPGMSGSFTVVALPVAALGPDITYCGDAIFLDAGNTDVAYLWSTGATTSVITVNSSDTFHVDVTNSCGTASDTIIVIMNPVPLINAGNDITICSGSTATLTATGGSSYVWLTGFQTTTSIVIAPTNSTFYSVIGSNSSGCTKMSTVNVTVTYPATVGVSGTSATCPADNDGTLQAAVTGGNAAFTYAWSTSPVQTSALATGLMPGSYSVTVTDTYGCISAGSGMVTGTAASLTTTFAASNGHDGNMFDVTALTNIRITGFDGNLDDGTSGGAGGYIKIYYKAGTHAGSETMASAWTLIDSVFVNPTANGIPTSIPILCNLFIPAGQTYAFYITGTNSGCGVDYSNGTAVGAVFSEDSNLQVKVGVGKSYPFASTFSPRAWNGIVHYCANAVVGSEEYSLLSDRGVHVFPNPFVSTTSVRLLGSVNGEVNFILFDVFGKTIRRYITGSSAFEIERNALPAGIYFYQAWDISGVIGTGKVIID